MVISHRMACSGMLRHMAEPRLTVAMVGAGNLARAVATWLPKAGIRIDEIVVRKRSRHSLPLARKCKAQLATFEDARFDADVIWLLVSDSAIRSCAEQISGSRNWKGKIVLHASGALCSDELQSLRRHGASVASAHPMMTFVPGEVPRMEGLAWTVEGDRRAVVAAGTLIRKLGGSVFEIKKKDKPLYHAFGAFLSPLLVVHLHAAVATAKAAGIPGSSLTRFMRPIVQKTLENLFAHIEEKGGTAKAFSGPLVRGDTVTIERHLAALRGRVPGPERLYRALVQEAAKSDLPVKNRREIESLLRRTSPASKPKLTN
jgi:predicted short-subunit dehydrogenase-like oxidoreductase (DUF2520 family)